MAVQRSGVATVKYGGLEGLTNAVTVEGGKTREYSFALAYGMVQIKSEPADVDVELNSKKSGNDAV